MAKLLESLAYDLLKTITPKGQNSGTGGITSVFD
jgi:hypothetical protein